MQLSGSLNILWHCPGPLGTVYSFLGFYRFTRPSGSLTSTPPVLLSPSLKRGSSLFGGDNVSLGLGGVVGVGGHITEVSSGVLMYSWGSL